MKTKLTIIILSLLLASALVYSGGYEVPLSRGEADTLYCQVNGVCDIANLTVGSLTLINGTVNFLNVTIVNYNVTGLITVDGNITVNNYFYQNGQSINDTIIWENSTGEARLKSPQDIGMQDRNINNAANITVEDNWFFEDKYHWFSRNAEDFFTGEVEQAYWLVHNRPHPNGTILFIMSHLNNTNFVVQSGQNLSTSFIGNSFFVIPNNLTESMDFNFSKSTNCHEIYDHFNVTIFLLCNTPLAGPDLGVVGSADIWERFRVRGTARFEEDFLITGTPNQDVEFDTVNVVWHPIIARDENLTVGGLFTIRDFFDTSISPFVNKNQDDWIIVTSEDNCIGDDRCAVSMGDNTLRTMTTTHNFNNTINLTFNFSYSVENWKAGDNCSFVVENGTDKILLWNKTGESPKITEQLQRVFINETDTLPFWNNTNITFNFNAMAITSPEACYIDDLIIKGFAGEPITFIIQRADARIDYGLERRQWFFNDTDKAIHWDGGLVFTGNITVETINQVTVNVSGNQFVGGNLTVGGIITENGTRVILNDTAKNYVGLFDKIGIGTATPQVPLHVIGNTLLDGELNVTGDLTVENVIILDFESIEDWDDLVVFVQGIWNSTFGNPNIWYNEGNVGIGTATPITALHVVGNISNDGLYNNISFTTSTSGVVQTIVICAGGRGDECEFKNHSRKQTTPSTEFNIKEENGQTFEWSNKSERILNNTIIKVKGFNVTGNLTLGTSIFIDTTNFRIGIGTLTPTSSLHVIGDLNVTGDIVGRNITSTQDIIINGLNVIFPPAVLTRNIVVQSDSSNGGIAKLFLGAEVLDGPPPWLGEIGIIISSSQGTKAIEFISPGKDVEVTKPSSDTSGNLIFDNKVGDLIFKANIAAGGNIEFTPGGDVVMRPFDISNKFSLRKDSPFTLGAGDDVHFRFNGNDLQIQSRGVTANDEVHFIAFDKYKFDNDVDIDGDLNVTGNTILGSPINIRNLTMFTNPSGNPACCGVMDDMSFGCTAGACS